ncbi:M28 family peptidase [Aquimarina sp. ERC-38]|uniref:M28 family peptidase n=1 Tax=Aquimarina sp. ERC-38 TaxID=2949996 RepID=UPI002245007C|nr:M28 family peptidase [Aquimarina sp. ERC-38]UZO81926.1 M28 family peptidase [Aquimarina sp. ERC-38]
MRILKEFQKGLLLLIIAVLGWISVFYSIPRFNASENVNISEFSTAKALAIVKKLSVAPHYVGTQQHDETKRVLLSELRKLGLQPEIQKGFAISKTGSCTYVQNIVAKIESTTSDDGILLLSHYDSAVHSSPGASDAASGVATILEGLRAYLASGSKPLNTIYICFSDGEEVGLLGAKLFTKEHPWLKNVKLVFNFEARGSGGGSFMLVETNQKNKNLITHFSKAKIPYPIANSLAYSVYKMLPNDTDLTVFREDSNINGYNFAFIDDHYDYHTAKDTWQNLNTSTLAHQGSYVTSILSYFSQLPNLNLTSDKDVIYFDLPVFGLIYYPATLIVPLLVTTALLLILCILLAKRQNLISFRKILYGIGILLLSILVVGSTLYFGWKLITILYPNYLEIQHGFTYNGHWYIYSAISLSAFVILMILRYTLSKKDQLSFYVSVSIFWFFIAIITAIYLEGATYFIWIVILSLIPMSLLIFKKESHPVILVLFSIPTIFIIAPFIYRLPVALGLQMLFISGILTVLLLCISIPSLIHLTNSRWIISVSGLVSLGFLITAHVQSGFSEEHPKPNSLLHITNVNTQQSVWATYDIKPDEWTSSVISKESSNADEYNENTIENKYGKQFSYVTPAPLISQTPLQFIKLMDSLKNSIRHIKYKVIFPTTMNRLDIYTDTIVNFKSLRINQKTADNFTYRNRKMYNAFTKRWSRNLATYYNTGTSELQIDLTIKKEELPKFTFYASTYNLLDNKQLNIPKRSSQMMTKPFLLNDAMVIMQTVDLDTISFIKPEEDIILKNSNADNLIN